MSRRHGVTEWRSADGLESDWRAGVGSLQRRWTADGPLAFDGLSGAAVVRDRPHGRTLALPGSRGLPAWFCKVRYGRVAAAAGEWRWLHELPRLGVRTARPLFLARAGQHTALGLAAVPGHEVALLLAGCGDPARRERFLLDVAVPVLRRLQQERISHRDLYLGHWHAESLDGPVAVIDLERCFRPRRRWRRWRNKDVAAVVASWPQPRADGEWSAFLDALELGAADRRDVLARAARMRRHVPRHGDPPAGRGTEA